MKNIMRVGVLVVLLSVPASVRAQCPSSAQLGHLGITSVECDCVIAPPTRTTQWRFFTEPKILRVERGSPADGRLQAGDVIVSVNGQPVTTSAGANLLARPPRDRDVVVGVRRDGRPVQYVTLRPTAVCATDARVLGATPATQRVQSTQPPQPGQRSQPSQPPQPTTPSAPVPPATVSAPGRVAPPSVWIGLAFSCGDCAYEVRPGSAVWTFRSSPEVYSVEPGSPAYTAGMRRGDVLTHVDEQAITSAEGGRRWASLKPGDHVRIRYRRGDATRTATLRVAASRTPSPAVTTVQSAREWVELQQTLAQRDSANRQLLRQYEQTLRAQQQMQEQMVRELRERGASAASEQRAQELRRQQEQLQELIRLRATEAARDDAVRRQLEQLLRESRLNTVPSPAPAPGTPTQRYSGTFGGVEVEVRGGNPVIVSEDGEELIIRMADGSTVRLRRPRR